uniref:Uncharacterized protein n=1 Tax=Suricata suricatta TaxID=37032 RepID=A0A673UT78_SURSU
MARIINRLRVCFLQGASSGLTWRPLWLRDMYRPLNATHMKNMAQKLHNKDSSDEVEIFKKKPGYVTQEDFVSKEEVLES